MQKLFSFLAFVPFVLFGTTLSLTEEVTLQVLADQAKVFFSVITDAPTPKKALDDNSEQMRTFQKYLASRGIRENSYSIRTLQLVPRYAYSEGSSHLDGYQAKNSIVFTTKDFALLRSLLAEAPQEGINQIDNLLFSSTKANEYEKQAMTLAIQKAIENAQAAAEAANLTVSGIESIKVLPASQLPAPFMLRSTSAQVPLPDTDISISAQVEITFTLSQ